MLTAHEPLRGAPARILVAGTSGSGKTTLAAQDARHCGDVLRLEGPKR